MLDYCEPQGIHEWHEPEPVWIDRGDAEQHDAVRSKRALAAAFKAIRAEEKSLGAQSLEIQFREQADKWDRETSHLSSPTQRMDHPSYQAILGMAHEHEKEIVKMLISDMEQNERPWFGALSYITKENPISRSDAGKMKKMILSWVKWGKDRKIL